MFDSKIIKTDLSLKNENKVLEGAAKVLGHKVRYTMFCHHAFDGTVYRFCISYRGERTECRVRCDRQTANKIFFSVLRGRVTPCSGEYVIRELTDDAENCIFIE